MKKLAILGASYLQLPLVKRAKELEIEVHCFAWDDDKAICKYETDFFYDISVLEKELILEKCKEVGIDGIVTIATDICVPVIAYVAEELNLVGNSNETAMLTTNKGLMRACFEENKIPSPKYHIIKTENDNQLVNLSFPLIVKPTDRSGSLGVVKVENAIDLKKAIQYCLEVSIEKSAVVEEYITGKEVSVETISWKGKHHVITITDKIITEEPYFVELAHHQPSQLPLEIQKEIGNISLKILEATKVQSGASHIELKIQPDGNISAIEIGSRMGGDFIGSDLVQLSTGFDYLKSVIKIALNQFDGKVEKTLNQFSGVYFLSENTRTLLPYFENSDNSDFEIVKKELQSPELKEIHSSNDRSGYLIYRATERLGLL